jgi:hypothetical protein
MMKLVDMARSADEVKKDLASVAPSPNAEGPLYSYGLCISLDEQDLKKLKLYDNKPSVGDLLHFTAMAKVTSVSEHESETASGEKRSHCRVELQVQQMGVPEDESREMPREKRMASRYGKDDDEGDDY